MKNILFILSVFLFTSCVTPTVVTRDSIYDNEYIMYYDDSRYIGYEIVWVDNWPYWMHNDVFIPYHHHHVLHYHPKHWEHRPGKPILKNNHFRQRYQPKHTPIYSRPSNRSIRQRTNERYHYNVPNNSNANHGRYTPRDIKPNTLHKSENTRPTPNTGNRRFNQPTRGNNPPKINHSSQNTRSNTGRGNGNRR